MSERAKKAIENHKKGYNCAQSVVCAFSDILGQDEEVLYRASEGYGLGMGTMGTCGAISGAVMGISCVTSDGELSAPGKTKAATYAKAREIQQMFKDKNQSTVCAVLKGATGGPRLRSCDGCIEDAAEILEEMLSR